MRITIGEKTYSVTPANQANLAVLLALKRASGLTLKDVQAGMERLQAIGGDEDLTPQQKGMEAISDEGALLALGAMIYMARYKAGESLSFEQACDFPLSDLSIDKEPGDEVEEPADPQ